ncbi:hypothetical protein [Haloarcula salinisoli]|jgi:DNA-directed RNA polymerase specialized sigma24 family protein|uniref:Uncharacterized protein n=1 Tax=Haloarcula salinisoli TaxID=2487746 RepID=A0A8J7YGH1_9EURY|nr:hypothetical protein [Halomicroarcula salinisoli]MBX0288049.1 hypothetical protein [Halomicroarcula salinisoli]MBX0305580.1 hypothetical protein [Halomicroarcula salinisoli]
MDCSPIGSIGSKTDLQVNDDELLIIQRALERVVQGYTYAEAAEERLSANQCWACSSRNVVISILRRNWRRATQAAAEELEPLDVPDVPADRSIPEQEIRTMVREEICRHQQ